MPLPSGLRGIVVDIEGTTTRIAFVTEVLFPFARQRLADALADPDFAEARALLEKDQLADRDAGSDDLAAYARELMDADRKATGLKALQGLIWKAGYESGALRGEVFEDVPPALQRWRQAGLVLAVFSSGSELAQRLLFSTTPQGDLGPYFSHFFDTRIGAKREASAYHEIAARMGLPPEGLLFLSDVPAELDAAREAGWQTGLLRRPGNPPAEAGPHPAYDSFEAL